MTADAAMALFNQRTTSRRKRYNVVDLVATARSTKRQSAVD